LVYYRKRTIGADECLIYQLIESCLKLNLDYSTAIKAINVVLKKNKKLFNQDNRTVRIEKMNYRNYRRYITELKKMSPVHVAKLENDDEKKLGNENLKSQNPFINSVNKVVELAQLENLLFLLNEDNQDLMYKKHVIADTDLLIMKALIYLDKKYVF
jgi:hypothetical protein